MPVKKVKPNVKLKQPKVPTTPNRECYGCGMLGVSEKDIRLCTHCGSDVCPNCDPGIGLSCGNCPT